MIFMHALCALMSIVYSTSAPYDCGVKKQDINITFIFYLTSGEST
jgi:hypothetical protein